MDDWAIDSWRDHQIVQQPDYEDQDELFDVEQQLKSYSPIVKPDQIDNLLKQLSEICLKGGVLVNLGDCAESIDTCNSDYVKKYVEMISDVRKLFGSQRFISIGRIAGQLSKPRASAYECKGGVFLPNYKGDMINNFDFNISSRIHDPKKLISGYLYSVTKFKYLKECSIDCFPYISHEALLLNYEQAFTRRFKDRYYCLTAHMVWIGNKTKFLDSAHIEYCRGIWNPIGVKIDHNVSADELVHLLKLLNPSNIPGKIILICRLGCYSVRSVMEALIRSVESGLMNVIWVCDPMHGNTRLDSVESTKLRCVRDLLFEFSAFLDVMREMGLKAVGMSLESSPDFISECCNCCEGQEEHKFFSSYQNSPCDPRMNKEQTIGFASRMRDSLEGRACDF